MGFFYANFDESGKKGDHFVVTFCGVCASRSALIAFERDWEGLLRYHGLLDEGFHMVNALRYSRPYGTRIPPQKPEDRLEALKPFADSINEHLEVGLIQAWEVKKDSPQWSALQDVHNLGRPDNPYYIAFARAMLELLKYVGKDDYISLICDHDSETSIKAYIHWQAICKAYEELKEKTVALTFANDKHFPALQAADFASWLARREAALVFHKKSYKFRALYEYLTTSKLRRGRCDWSYCFVDKVIQDSLKNNLEPIDDKRVP